MRFYLAQEGHVVNALPPVDVDGGWTSDYFNMKNYSHASIILQFGVTEGAVSAIKLKAASDAGGTGAETVAFSYFAETAAAGDTLGAKTAAAADTGIVPPATDNIMYVIEIDAAELPDDKPWLAFEVTNGSGNTVLMSGVAVLSGGRYKSDQSATVIA
jgi:hypothetical protein